MKYNMFDQQPIVHKQPITQEYTINLETIQEFLGYDKNLK